jgi:regulator of replication initiation timing
MRNPFKKHTEDHDDIWDAVYELTQAYFALVSEVKDLREEVDFLVDELDD